MTSKAVLACLGLCVFLAAQARAFFPQMNGGPGGLMGMGMGMNGFMGMGMMGAMGGGDMFGGFGEGMNNMIEMKYNCYTDGGTCLNMYVQPGAPAGGEPGETPEVEVEGPPKKPAGPKNGGKPGARAGPGAGPGATRAPPQPKRMVANPMAHIRQSCVSWEPDPIGCGHNGGICCYQTP